VERSNAKSRLDQLSMERSNWIVTGYPRPHLP
jgi:hypothetical protein